MDQSKDNKEKEFYQREIIKMVEGIENVELLESIYWFVKVIFEKFNKKREG